MSNPFINQLKYQFRSGSMHIRLILVNLIVFLGIRIAMAIAEINHSEEALRTIGDIFCLNTNPSEFIKHPWGLLTSIFSHFDFLHFLLNMLFLYVSGNMFLQFFTNRRLLHVYIIGGIAGGLFELIANNFHSFHGMSLNLAVVGASGSIMAIFIALAVHKPNIQVLLFGAFPVKLIVLAGFYILMDLLKINSNDGTAHFAHLGGALIGFLSVTNLNSSRNIINMSESFGQRFKKFWSGIFKPGPRMKVEKGGGSRPKTDEEFNMDKKARQQKTNKILDKISKSGYESLSKAEKEFLFSQSQK